LPGLPSTAKKEKLFPYLTQRQKGRRGGAEIQFLSVRQELRHALKPHGMGRKRGPEEESDLPQGDIKLEIKSL